MADINIYDSIRISEQRRAGPPGILLPQGADPLNVPDHALSHRVFAHTASSPAESVTVDNSGNTSIQTNLNVGGTINGLTESLAAAGFTISGNSATLTVPANASVTNTNTGDQTLVSLGAEAVANKVTSISGASTDVQYPSAKLLYDQLATKQATLVSNSNIKTVGGNTLLGAGDVAVSNIVWKGAYNPLTPYIINDGVSYNGSSYICILASTGNVPTNNTYWNILASMGDPGISGVSGALTTPFTGQTSVTVTHNFNAYPAVQVIDGGGLLLIPLTVTHTSPNAFTVTFNTSTTGNIIATIGGVSTTVVTKSADYTLLPTDNLVLVTAAATMTLPATTGIQGKTYSIKDMATSGIAVVVNTTGGKTIDGDSSKTMVAKYTNLTVFTDGSNWFII